MEFLSRNYRTKGDNMTCVICGGIIPQERIEKINTDRCVVCQKKIEEENQKILNKKRARGQQIMEVPSLALFYYFSGIEAV